MQEVGAFESDVLQEPAKKWLQKTQNHSKSTHVMQVSTDSSSDEEFDTNQLHIYV